MTWLRFQFYPQTVATGFITSNTLTAPETSVLAQFNLHTVYLQLSIGVLIRLKNILYVKHAVFVALSHPDIQFAIGAIIIVSLRINIRLCKYSTAPQQLLLRLQIWDREVKESIHVHMLCMEYCVIRSELRILIAANILSLQKYGSAE